LSVSTNHVCCSCYKSELNIGIDYFVEEKSGTTLRTAPGLRCVAGHCGTGSGGAGIGGGGFDSGLPVPQYRPGRTAAATNSRTNGLTTGAGRTKSSFPCTPSDTWSQRNRGPAPVPSTLTSPRDQPLPGRPAAMAAAAIGNIASHESLRAAWRFVVVQDRVGEHNRTLRDRMAQHVTECLAGT